MTQRAFLVLVCLSVLGVISAMDVQAQKKQSPMDRAKKLWQIRVGKKLFEANECSACHIVQGKGPAGGVKLDDVGEKRTPAFLTNHLADPEAHVAKHASQYGFQPNLMPNPNLSDGEREAIVRYLISLSYKPVERTVPASLQPSKAKQQKERASSKKTSK